MYKNRKKTNTFRVPLKSTEDAETLSVSQRTSGMGADTPSSSKSTDSYELLPLPALPDVTTTASLKSNSSSGEDCVRVPSKKRPPSASYTSLLKAVAPRGEANEEDSPKPKRIHLDIQECMEHSNTADGGKALAQPTEVVTSSKDPNRGLYPRQPREKSVRVSHTSTFGSGSFVKASEMGMELPVAVQNELASRNNPVSEKQHQVTPGVDGWRYEKKPYQKKRKMIGNQSNTLKSYFSQPKISNTEDSASLSENMSEPRSSHNVTTTSQSTDDCFIVENASSESFSKVKESGDSVDRSSVDNTSRYKTQCVVTVPDLPSLSSPSPTKKPQDEILYQKGAKHKGAKKTRIIKETPRAVGPSAHNLRKASFLYDSELAKAEPGLTVKNPPDKYGLLGSGNYPRSEREESGSFFDLLPYELIENVFCSLPMLDLYLNVNRVCLMWNDIISDPKFLPWKKRYHKLKAGIVEDWEFMRTALTTNQITSIENFLPQLIRYMKDFKVVTATDMDGCLQNHSKYEYARALLAERFPECIGANQVANPWCVVTALVIVSEYVPDIQEIHRVLLSHTSQCTVYEVIECLYCLATFLFHFTSIYRNAPWNGMHYRLYYALYLLENESTITSDQLQDAASHGRGGQQSLIKYTSGSTVVQMTHEQRRICNHNVKNGDIIKIVAFAGTGKTTTLVKYTQLRPNIKFLLIVYNKSIQRHAESKFPKNVKCKTGHALAFRRVGRLYADKGKLSGSGLKVTDILNNFSSCKGESLYVQAKFIITTLNNFMSSPDPFITTAHVPHESVDDNGVKKSISHQHRVHYSEQATVMWEKMIDLNNQRTRITHDTYLKLYQLQRPRIYDCDVILIDEAQDMTPALTDVLMAQQQAKILVGDPHQQIYAFRGAVNAMQQVQDSQTFYLTQSFRFGSEIAFVAASCLSVLKGEKKKTLVGNATTGSVRGGVDGQLAIITRSNFTLFNEAVKKCCYSSTKHRIAFVGGTDAFGFEMILDIYALMSTADGRESIRNRFIAGFSTVGELEKYAIKTSDAELLGKIKIVKTYHHSLPSLISKIRSRCIRDEDLADILLSTAHKAKGLEFSTVRLTEDFCLDVGALSGRGQQQEDEDESNLLYVAVTRAKKRLILTNTLGQLLRQSGEKFLYPVLTKKLQDDGVVLECESTGASFKPCDLTLVKRAVSMSEECNESDMVFSPETVDRDFISLRNLYGRPEEEEKQ